MSEKTTVDVKIETDNTGYTFVYPTDDTNVTSKMLEQIEIQTIYKDGEINEPNKGDSRLFAQVTFNDQELVSVDRY